MVPELDPPPCGEGIARTVAAETTRAVKVASCMIDAFLKGLEGLREFLKVAVESKKLRNYGSQRERSYNGLLQAFSLFDRCNPNIADTRQAASERLTS